MAADIAELAARAEAANAEDTPDAQTLPAEVGRREKLRAKLPPKLPPKLPAKLPAKLNEACARLEARLRPVTSGSSSPWRIIAEASSTGKRMLLEPKLKPRDRLT